MHQLKTKTIGGLVGVENNEGRILNLCPHAIHISSPGNEKDVIEIPQSGMVARMDRRQSDIEKHAGFPIIREVYGDIFGLPEPVKGTVYIVSAPVLNVLNDSRKDVVGIGKQMKNVYGKAIHTVAFRRQF